MKLAALLSGGKDSVYAFHLMSAMGNSVEYAITVVPANRESFMFHTVNISIAPLIAIAAGATPVVVYNSSEEKELSELEEALERMDIEGLVTGAIRSNFQWGRLNYITEKLSIPLFSPLWRRSEADILREEIESGMAIFFSSINAEGIPKEYAGRRLSMETLDELIGINRAYDVNICGEGGEYETVVLDAPFFSRRIEAVKDHYMNERDCSYWFIDGVKFVRK